MRQKWIPWRSVLLLMVAALIGPIARAGEERSLSLAWSNEMLTIRGPHLPGGELPVWYLEAFCRPGSTGRDWKETVIPHKTRLVEASAEGRLIRLRSELEDGVVVDHEIRAGDDEVGFPRGRHQSPSHRVAGPLGAALHPGRSVHGHEVRASL